MAGNGQQGATTSSSNITDIVKSYYPDILTTSYTVPPIHFNRVRSEKKTDPGTKQPVPLPVPVPVPSPEMQYEDEIQADFAQQHVLTNLGQLAKSKSEVMFIISELAFKNYLNKEPTEDTNTLPDGDFDIFIIHRRYGILVGEIKSTRWKKPNADDEIDTSLISWAIKQLKKSEVKAKDMISKVAPGLPVRKTLILPYVSSHQLKRILKKKRHYQLLRNLLEALKAENAEEAVELCLFSDQLSHPDKPWDVTPDVLDKLGAWWGKRMACATDPLLTDQSYLDFVARLVGPATTITVHSNCRPRIDIEVRTEGEAVAELARRLATFVLTPDQVGLMNRNPRLICLTGPPGTGKTLVMELQGLRWLLEGRDVHAVSTACTSRAINIKIEDQLKIMLEPNSHPDRGVGTVYRHEYNFYKEEECGRAVEELSACEKDGTLRILMDEANFTESVRDGKRNRRLVTELAGRVPDLHLWAARLGHKDVPPELEEENLTLPLRSAPSVLREVEKALCVYDDITVYSNNGVPSPADGPCVVRLSHHGDGHTGVWPVNCQQCGHNVAAELRRLHVGTTGKLG